LALIAAAGILAFKFSQARPPLWEWLMAAGLVVATTGAARSGVWLLFFLAPPAAASFRPAREWRALIPVVALAALAGIVYGSVRGPVRTGASPRLVEQAVVLAHRSPVVAEGGIEEQVALAGGSILIGDPIDAFSKHDQNAYLDWLDGQRRGLQALDGRVHVVMVLRGSDAQRLMSQAGGFTLVGSDQHAMLYERGL
jgi:hypothetical protein